MFKSKINWEEVNYLKREVIDWWGDDREYAVICLESIGKYVPALINKIQSLAKENARLRKIIADANVSANA